MVRAAPRSQSSGSRSAPFPLNALAKINLSKIELNALENVFFDTRRGEQRRQNLALGAWLRGPDKDFNLLTVLGGRVRRGFRFGQEQPSSIDQFYVQINYINPLIPANAGSQILKRRRSDL